MDKVDAMVYVMLSPCWAFAISCESIFRAHISVLQYLGWREKVREYEAATEENITLCMEFCTSNDSKWLDFIYRMLLVCILASLYWNRWGVCAFRLNMLIIAKCLNMCGAKKWFLRQMFPLKRNETSIHCTLLLLNIYLCRQINAMMEKLCIRHKNNDQQ